MLRLDLDIDLINVYVIVFLLAVTGLFILFDVNYFIRIALTIGYGKLFERKIKITDTSDINMHRHQSKMSYNEIKMKMFHLDLNIDFVMLAVIVPLIIIAAMSVLFDMSAIIRTALIKLYNLQFENYINVNDTTESQTMAITSDMDLFLNNMSNSRYIREADFGRFHFLERSGLYNAITAAKAHILQGACNVRFRRPISLLTPFKVTTKIIYWDEKCIYFEQQFITRDNFVRAVAVSQNKVLNADVGEIMGKLLDKDASYRIDVPEEVKLWIASMDESSNRLRKQD